MNLAAYLTWATIAYSIWRESAKWTGISGIPARDIAALLMAGFLVAFALRNRSDALGPTVVSFATLIATSLGLLLFGPQSATPVLLVIVAAAVFARSPLPQAWAILGLTNAAFLAILIWRWQREDTLFVFMIYGVFQLFAAATVAALARASTAADALRRTNAELLATRSLLAEAARDGERLRVARELHDVAGHKLTALALNIDILRHDQMNLSGKRELELLRHLTSELMSDLRSVVSRLRQDDGIDLREAIQRIAEVLPSPAVHIQIEEAARAGDADIAQTLVRVAQEALTNAARHAHAVNVWLSITARGDAIEMLIEDDGTFPGHLTEGHGLAGMRERVSRLGGALEIAGSPRGGLRVAARVPQAHL